MNPNAHDLTVHFRREFAPGDGPVRAWYLVMVEGAEPGRRFRLAAEPLLIGRAGPVDLLLNDAEVSRRHCTIAVDPKLGVVVSDLDSTNGSYIDGQRVRGSSRLNADAFLQIGGHVFRCEWLTQAEAARVAELEEDTRRARDYVQALLPAPIDNGPVSAAWSFVPSAQLGGDSFGYHWIDRRHFAMHLIDVSGHGSGAALHSASITTLLRNQAMLSQECQPERIVAHLNDSFPMDEHAQMCFTVWCGVYDAQTRRLAYCSAGHPPALLRDANQGPVARLFTPNLVAGVVPGYRYRAATVDVAPGAVLHVFSDGVFEVRDAAGDEGGLEQFAAQLERCGGAPAAALEDVRRRAAGNVLEDDFTLLRFEFH